MRRKTKNTLTLICGVLALALLTGLVLNLYGAFDKKKVNPDNLINGEISGYKTADTYNNGYGVKYTVEKNGTVKAFGTATADDVFTVATGIKLTSGKTYTLSCGNNSVGYKSFGLRLHNMNATSGAANEYIYANLDGTFTAANSTDSYNVEVYVMKDAKVFATFRPVLVEGKTAGDFLVK